MPCSPAPARLSLTGRRAERLRATGHTAEGRAARGVLPGTGRRTGRRPSKSTGDPMRTEQQQQGPLMTRVQTAIVTTFRLAGADPEMGPRLRRTIAEAGLPAPEMQGETLLACGPEASSWGR